MDFLVHRHGEHARHPSHVRSRRSRSDRRQLAGYQEHALLEIVIRQ